jgi:CHAT domain-containing protein/Tfp pilus assembly protein PilF
MRPFLVLVRHFVCSLAFMAMPAMVWGQQPAVKELTPEQKEKLKERNRLSNEAVALENEGKLREAIAAAEKMLTIERGVFGDVHEDVVDSLKRLARMHERMDDFASAKKARQEVLSLQIKLHGEKDWQATNARLDLSDTEMFSKLDMAARRELREANELTTKAVASYRTGKYQEGAEYAKDALEIQLRILGEQNRNTARTLNNLGLLLQNQGNYVGARLYYEQALAIQKKILGDSHPDTAMSLNNLGGSLQKQGDYAGARPYFEQALAIRKKVLGDNHLDTAASLNNLGSLLYRRGDYAGARPYFEQALAIKKKVLGDNHPDTALSLNNLGLLLHSQGDYAGARPYYDQALAIRKKVFGDNHPDTAISLNNLGLLLYRQGDYAGARPYYEQALAIYKKVLGDNHPDTATSVNNLGALLNDQGDYAGARLYYEQALAIKKKVLGDNHPDTALSLNNLGLLLDSQGDFTGARTYYDQALAIYKKVLGDNHPETAASLGNLGFLLSSQGDYAGARPYYDQALTIRKKVLGDNHPDTAGSLSTLGDLLYSQGDYTRARSYYEQALAISRHNLDLAASAQSERQQFLMRNAFVFQLDAFLSLPENTKEQAAAAFGHVLAWKGALFARQQCLRLERADATLAPLVAELRLITGQAAKLAFAVPDPKNLQAHRKQLADVMDKKEALERSLAQKSQAFRQDMELKQLTAAQFVQLLPADTALVDLLVYRHQRPDPEKKGKWLFEQRLTAFVLSPGSAVVRIELGPMAPIEAAIASWRSLTKTRGEGKDHPGDTLRKLLWEPLATHVTGAKTVLIAPDGALGTFPFAALPGSKAGSYLLEETALAVAPMPRHLPVLLAQAKSPETEPALLLVGDVDFEAAAGEGGGGGHTAATSRSGARHAWKKLEGTRGEIVTIRDTFEQRFSQGTVKVLRGPQATEQALRDLAKQYTHLHLATHGFFAPPEVKSALALDATALRNGDLLGNREVISGFDPGLMSGLVLAGANRVPEPGKDDGILTALEVAELDLTKGQLVVLSACETGLGKVAGGEGLLGLQRAFQVAGAKSVVASLWQVDDDATRKLMERFYENLWQKKLSRQEALRQAQLAMLRGELVRGAEVEKTEPGPRRLPPHYWAAFVLSGDWR